MSNPKAGYPDVRTRVRATPEGKLLFVRFTLAQRVEHLVLIVSFTMLAVTGLVQKFSTLELSVFAIRLMGGIETVRQIHHFFALVIIGLSVYHVAHIVHLTMVHKQQVQMWPNRQDLRDAVQMVRFNLGRASSRPRFGRYSFEEKMEYWALIWGTVIMIITGLILWFPIGATEALPGEVIPVARSVHGWEALLAVLAILTWHLYHTVIKTLNKSIFTGVMTEEEMQHEHPLEYQAMMAELQESIVPSPAMTLAPAATLEPELVVVEPDGNGRQRKRNQRQAKAGARPSSRKRNTRQSKATVSAQPGEPDMTIDHQMETAAQEEATDVAS